MNRPRNTISLHIYIPAISHTLHTWICICTCTRTYRNVQYHAYNDRDVSFQGSQKTRSGTRRLWTSHLPTLYQDDQEMWIIQRVQTGSGFITAEWNSSLHIIRGISILTDLLLTPLTFFCIIHHTGAIKLHECDNHRRNKRHKGGKMSSLLFWLFLHSISVTDGCHYLLTEIEWRISQNNT